jgi:transposase
MGRPSKYSPELRERAVRMVFAQTEEHPSQWQPFDPSVKSSGAARMRCGAWVRQAERDAGERPMLTTDEWQRLKDLERENFELKRANEILRKASAFFAQAELSNWKIVEIWNPRMYCVIRCVALRCGW